MCGIIERTNIWLAEGEGSHYTAAATATSSLSFREDAVDVIIWAPAEVRRCRFIDPAAAALAPIRLVGDIRVPDSPPDIELVVDDRGRVDDAASFGNDDPPFRDALCGVPDARFLHASKTASAQPGPRLSQRHTRRASCIPFLNHISLQRQRTHNAMQFLTRSVSKYPLRSNDRSPSEPMPKHHRTNSISLLPTKNLL